MALPPTVNDATNALIKNCILKSNPKFLFILIVNIALIAPLKTPAISPITSLHILDTLGADLISFIAVLAPLT